MSVQIMGNTELSFFYKFHSTPVPWKLERRKKLFKSFCLRQHWFSPAAFFHGHSIFKWSNIEKGSAYFPTYGQGRNVKPRFVYFNLTKQYVWSQCINLCNFLFVLKFHWWVAELATKRLQYVTQGDALVPPQKGIHREHHIPQATKPGHCWTTA